MVEDCLSNANLTISDLSGIAVTNRPGLPLSLIIGVRYAKHLARKYDKPLIPIHHMEAHALTALMNNNVKYPFLCLLASGGHSLLVYVKTVSEFFLLGDSLDDSPGELFDKISRDLKLRNIPEYSWLSGGAAIEKAAKLAKCPARFEFPLPLARQRDCQFSFSGLKNTARRHIEQMEKKHSLGPDEVIPHYEDFCASLLRAVTRHLCHRTQRAIEFCDAENLLPSNDLSRFLVFSGGVACNDFIFDSVSQMAGQFGLMSVRPMKKYCTDNGVMIAWNGVEKLTRGIDLHEKERIDEIVIQKRSPLGVNSTDKVRDKSIACKWVKIPLLRENVNSR